MNQQARTINHALASETGRLMWTVSKTLITLTLTALMTIATGYLHDISTKQDDQIKQNVRQDLSLQSLQQLTQSQQHVIDANSTTVRTVGEQVLRNTDAIAHLKDLQLQQVRQARHGQ